MSTARPNRLLRRYGLRSRSQREVKKPRQCVPAWSCDWIHVHTAGSGGRQTEGFVPVTDGSWYYQIYRSLPSRHLYSLGPDPSANLPDLRLCRGPRGGTRRYDYEYWVPEEAFAEQESPWSQDSPSQQRNGENIPRSPLPTDRSGRDRQCGWGRGISQLHVGQRQIGGFIARAHISCTDKEHAEFSYSVRKERKGFPSQVRADCGCLSPAPPARAQARQSKTPSRASEISVLFILSDLVWKSNSRLAGGAEGATAKFRGQGRRDDIRLESRQISRPTRKAMGRKESRTKGIRPSPQCRDANDFPEPVPRETPRCCACIPAHRWPRPQLGLRRAVFRGDLFVS